MFPEFAIMGHPIFCKTDEIEKHSGGKGGALRHPLNPPMIWTDTKDDIPSLSFLWKIFKHWQAQT